MTFVCLGRQLNSVLTLNFFPAELKRLVQSTAPLSAEKTGAHRRLYQSLADPTARKVTS
jgi:hypothetical protein